MVVVELGGGGAGRSLEGWRKMVVESDLILEDDIVLLILV